MADQQTIISARIQNRRGLRQNLPQPLLPGELGLATDTGQLFIGADPTDPASITSPIVEIYNDFITDTISNEAIENSYVAVANQILGTVPELPATVSVNTTTGSGAELSATITNGGPIDTIEVVNGGSGYTVGVSASIVDSDTNNPGSGAVLSVTRTGTSIASISIDVAGSGYIDPVVVLDDVAGSGAEFRATALRGEITAIVPDAGGTGYEVGDGIEIGHPYGTGFEATVSSVNGSGAIQSVNINLQGRNYQPVQYGYVIRVKLQEYSFIGPDSTPETALAAPDIPTDDLPDNSAIMFVPEYERIDSEYAEHEWAFIAYRKPVGKNIPSLSFTYVDDLSVPEGSQTTTTQSFNDVHLVPYPFATTPFDNEPFYSFTGKTLDLSIQFPGDEPYNSADAAAVAQAINWAFNNGVSGFEYINDGAVTDQGITGATGRGRGLVTVAQNIEIETDRGNNYNNEIATLVRELRSTARIANNDEFNTGLESQFPNPRITVTDDILSQVIIDTQGSGYLFPVVAVEDSVAETRTPLTDGLGDPVVSLALNRSITDITVDNAGNGYILSAEAPSVIIVDEPLGEPIGAPGDQFDITTYDGVIAEVIVENEGIGFTEADYRVYCANADTNDPVDFDVIITNGRVSGVRVNYGGNGFLFPRVFIFDKPIWTQPNGAQVFGELASDEQIVPVLEVSGIDVEPGTTGLPTLTGNETVLINNADTGLGSVLGLTVTDAVIEASAGAIDSNSFTVDNPGENYTLDSRLGKTIPYQQNQLHDNTIDSGTGNPTNAKPYVTIDGVEYPGLSVKFSVVDALLVKGTTGNETEVSTIGSNFSPTQTRTQIIDPKGAAPGLTATADVEVSSNEISDINISNNGAGYYTAEVLITGTGTGATASPVIRNGVISSIDVVDPGQYYSYETFTINSQAEIDYDDIEFNGVDGITGPGGSTVISLENQGAGYTRAPLVTITDNGPGTGASASADITDGNGNLLGYVREINIINPGSGYSDPVITIGTPNTDIAVNINQVTGEIDSVTVNNGGAGYNVNGAGDTRIEADLTLDDPGPGTGAQAELVLTGIVDSVTVDNGGSGYTNPTATIDDPSGTGATVTVTESGGVINSITVDTAGSGYTETPTITISDPTGTGASATVIVDGIVEDVIILDGGNNYINPTVNIPGSASATATFGVIPSGTVLPDNFVLSLTPNQQLVIIDRYADLSGSYSGGTGATITPIVNDGVITDIEFPLASDFGLGYISDPDITIQSTSGINARVSATTDINSRITSVQILNGGVGYPSADSPYQIDTATPNAPLPDLYLAFSPPDGLRSTGIWYDLDEADVFTIRYSIKNTTDLRKGELSVGAINNEFLIEDRFLDLTNDTDPLRLTFVPEIDSINNIIEIKYSARNLPSEDVNPTSLSTNTLRWKNF